MVTEIYIEALLVDEEAADAVWEAWCEGELSDYVAVWMWWFIVCKYFDRKTVSVPNSTVQSNSGKEN